MDLPIDIKIQIDSLLEGYKMSELRDRVSNLINRYKYESGNNIIIVDDELNSKIYASYRMPATFKVSYDVIDNIKSIYHEDIKTVIDVGAGSGASSIAISYLYNLEHITALEKNENMLEIGRFLTQNLNISWKQYDLLSDEINEKSDLVIASYVLNELDKSSRLNAVKKMYDSAQKLLVIIEPGTKVGSSIIQEIREQLINLGGNIVAPCTHQDKCDYQWCHFASRVQRSKLHKLIKEGELGYEDEKYSYIIASKTPCNKAKQRLIRKIKENNVVISSEICEEDGVKAIDVTKRDKALFKSIKKMKSNDIIK